MKMREASPVQMQCNTNTQSPHDGVTGGTILTPAIGASQFNTTALTEGGVTYCDFGTGANLIKGEVYWVAIKWDKQVRFS